MKKRVLAFMLSGAMLLGTMPAAFAAEVISIDDSQAAVTVQADVVDSGNCGTNGDNVTWSLDSDGILTISGTGDMASYYSGSAYGAPWHNYSNHSYSNSIKAVVIGADVTSIGDYAFADCTGLESIEIPNGVTVIGYGAFSGCEGLTSVAMSEGVQKIDTAAFQECKGLKNIVIPDSVTSIGRYAFSYCESLESVNIPNGITSIDEFTFNSCKSLTSIDIPESVTEIGKYAFYACTDLKTLTFRGNAPTIGEYAFEAVSAVVRYPENNTTWTDEFKKALQDRQSYEASAIRFEALNANGEPNHTGGEATCTAKATCENCGELYGSLDADNHTDAEAVWDKTETTHQKKWNCCGASEGSAENHTWENGTCTKCDYECQHTDTTATVTTEATCTEEGIKTFKCKNCDDSYTETIKAKGHTPETLTAVAATCTEDGLTAGTKCSVCNTVITAQETVKALGHDYKIEVTKKPTTTEKGEKKLTCNRCGDEKLEEIPATGSVHSHTYKQETTKDATCTETGTVTYTCSCGAQYTNSIPAKGHTEESVKATAPTCTENGMTAGKKCSVCGITLEGQEIVKALGHTAVTDPLVKATRTKDGKTEGSHCSTCGEVLTEQETIYKVATIKLKKKNHTYNAKKHKPGVVVKDSEGNVIDPSNYKVKYYGKRKNVGKYKVTVTLKGDQYKGKKTLYFTVRKK